jgi:hypothetical protein
MCVLNEWEGSASHDDGMTALDYPTRAVLRDICGEAKD